MNEWKKYRKKRLGTKLPFGVVTVHKTGAIGFSKETFDTYIGSNVVEVFYKKGALGIKPVSKPSDDAFRVTPQKGGTYYIRCRAIAKKLLAEYLWAVGEEELQTRRFRGRYDSSSQMFVVDFTDEALEHAPLFRPKTQEPKKSQTTSGESSAHKKATLHELSKDIWGMLPKRFYPKDVYNKLVELGCDTVSEEELIKKWKREGLVTGNRMGGYIRAE